MKYKTLIVLSFFVLSCKSEPNSPGFDGKTIIDESIKTSGSNRLKNAKINFDFRERHYSASRKKGQFALSRLTVDEEGDTIIDVLKNKGFQRFINDSLTYLPDSLVARFSPSVNSVHYFSALPFGLDAAAVNATWIGNETLKEKKYHKIKITFDEAGGGEDFEDVFIYWINTETFFIDYLAYSYEELDGQGLRFREAYNPRNINGVRLVNYNNYKPEGETLDLNDLGKQFEQGKLELLSKIELQNIEIQLFDNL